MSIEQVNIFRVVDGLILVSSMGAKSSSNSGDMDEYKSNSKHIIRKINHKSPTRIRIEAGNYIYSTFIEHGICYMTLTTKSYPVNLTFRFLDSIAKSFQEDLVKDHGNDWLRAVETAGRQYTFIKFDRIIQKIRREFESMQDNLDSNYQFVRKSITEYLEKSNDEYNNNFSVKSNNKKYDNDKNKGKNVSDSMIIGIMISFVISLVILFYFFKK